MTTNFENFNDEDLKSKAYLDEKLSNLQGQISYIEKNYNEFKLHNKKDLLIERAVRMIIQFLYDKGSIDNLANADQVL